MFCKNYIVDFVVIDEVHQNKQRYAEASLRRQRLELFIRLCEKKNSDLYLVGQSGTPVINSLKEGKSLVELITGESYEDIGDKATLKNCIMLNRALGRIGIRWKPEYEAKLNRQEVEVDCSEFSDELIELAKSKNRSVLALEQILTEVRLPVILDNLQKGTIIYTHLVDEIIPFLKQKIEEKNWSVGIFDGNTKTGLSDFKEGRVNILIASSAIGTGVASQQ